MKNEEGGKKAAEASEANKRSGGPVLLYVMLALIVGLLTLFLVLKPCPSGAGTSKSSVLVPVYAGRLKRTQLT